MDREETYKGKRLVPSKDGGGWIVTVVGVGATLKFQEHSDALKDARKIVDHLKPVP